MMRPDFCSSGDFDKNLVCIFLIKIGVLWWIQIWHILDNAILYVKERYNECTASDLSGFAEVTKLGGEISDKASYCIRVVEML